jgi:hypothetical protein
MGERSNLNKAITEFVGSYSPAEGLSSKLEIQHIAPFTGPGAIMPKPWPEPFKFCAEEALASKRAFQSFGVAVKALQAHVLPNQDRRIEFKSCYDLGIFPKCGGLNSSARP